MVLCQLFGHRPRFTADGTTMRWECQRGCRAGGSKQYASAEQATRFARGLNREDREDLGRRAPLVGLLPLRLARLLRRRRDDPDGRPPSHR
jgi:hypothetical protein